MASSFDASFFVVGLFLLSDRAIITAESKTRCRKCRLKFQSCCLSLNCIPQNSPLHPFTHTQAKGCRTYASKNISSMRSTDLGCFAVCTASRLCLEAGPAQRKCLRSALCQLQPLVWITCGCHDDERASGAR